MPLRHYLIERYLESRMSSNYLNLHDHKMSQFRLCVTDWYDAASLKLSLSTVSWLVFLGCNDPLVPVIRSEVLPVRHSLIT